MPRTVGAKNLKPFADRSVIETSAHAVVKHLTDSLTATPLDQFKIIIKHQTNYIDWIRSRHNELGKFKALGGRRAKRCNLRKISLVCESASPLRVD
jgi:hypothetical protein